MTPLLEQAFRAIDAGSPIREIGLVAQTLVESGDRETLRILDEAAGSREAFAALVDEVVELGGSHLEVLDLVSEVSQLRAFPGSRPSRTRRNSPAVSPS